MVSGLAAIVAISDSNSEHLLRLRAGLALLEKLCHGEINVIISQRWRSFVNRRQLYLLRLPSQQWAEGCRSGLRVRQRNPS